MACCDGGSREERQAAGGAVTKPFASAVPETGRCWIVRTVSEETTQHPDPEERGGGVFSVYCLLHFKKKRVRIGGGMLDNTILAVIKLVRI